MSFERTTPCGVISGTACQWPGIAAYKGIRYATAGRWEFPVPVTHWDGVYDATQYGACCYQPAPSITKPPHPEKPSTTTSSARAKRILTARTACS